MWVNWVWSVILLIFPMFYRSFSPVPWNRPPFLRGASCFLPCAGKQTQTAKAESRQFLRFLFKPRWVSPIYPSTFRLICNNVESVKSREIVQISHVNFPTRQKDSVQSPYFPIRFPNSSPWNCSLASLRSCNTRACNRSRRPTREVSQGGSPFARKVGIGGITHPNCVFHSPCFGHFKRRWWWTSWRRLPSQLRLRKNQNPFQLCLSLPISLLLWTSLKARWDKQRR